MTKEQFTNWAQSIVDFMERDDAINNFMQSICTEFLMTPNYDLVHNFVEALEDHFPLQKQRYMEKDEEWESPIGQYIYNYEKDTVLVSFYSANGEKHQHEVSDLEELYTLLCKYEK